MMFFCYGSYAPVCMGVVYCVYECMSLSECSLCLKAISSAEDQKGAIAIDFV